MSDCNECPRNRNDCAMLDKIVSDCGLSFFCVGYNRIEDRKVNQDRFTVCFKNQDIDELGHWDKRDIIDQMRVLSCALSVDENIRVSERLSEDEMNNVNLIQ